MALASLEASEFSLRTNNLEVCSAHLNQSMHSSRRERKKKRVVFWRRMIIRETGKGFELLILWQKCVFFIKI